MFTRTTAINKLLSLNKRKKVIQGGTWAGKTYGIIAVLINYAASNPNKHITVVAETIPSLKAGALKQFKEIMMLTGRWVESRFNGTELSYKFGNGSLIEFKSFDSVGKAQASGKRTDLFINEAPYIPYEIADALITRTTDNIWIDFNPTSRFWAHDEILTNDDAEFLLLKYTDNETLPETILYELNIKIEKARQEQLKGINGHWTNWKRVYVDGEIGTLQGVVFNNWSIIDGLPKEAELVAYGLDWGFSVDPTALVGIYKYNRSILIHELIYKRSLTNSLLVAEMKSLGVPEEADIIADSSDPKSIQDLCDLGYYNTIGCTKGKDSVEFGISKMQEYDLLITSTSLNTIKEFRNYRYKNDKMGKQTGEPIDSDNHTIDPTRYVVVDRIASSGGYVEVC